MSMMATTCCLVKRREEDQGKATHQTILYYRDDNLALAVSVTSDMAGPLIYIWHSNRPRLGGRCATDSAAKGYGLTGYLALEGPEYEVLWGGK